MYCAHTSITVLVTGHCNCWLVGVSPTISRLLKDKCFVYSVSVGTKRLLGMEEFNKYVLNDWMIHDCQKTLSWYCNDMYRTCTFVCLCVCVCEFIKSHEVVKLPSLRQDLMSQNKTSLISTILIYSNTVSVKLFYQSTTDIRRLRTGVSEGSDGRLKYLIIHTHSFWSKVL